MERAEMVQEDCMWYNDYKYGEKKCWAWMPDSLLNCNGKCSEYCKRKEEKDK